MTKEQKIAKNVAKYGWRYEILDKWVLANRIPASEKSVFSQLKARTQTFGEKIAKRLWERYGIEGIYLSNQNPEKQSKIISKLEEKLLLEFRRLDDEELKHEAIGFIKGLSKNSAKAIKVSTLLNGEGNTISDQKKIGRKVANG